MIRDLKNSQVTIAGLIYPAFDKCQEYLHWLTPEQQAMIVSEIWRKFGHDEWSRRSTLIVEGLLNS